MEASRDVTPETETEESFEEEEGSGVPGRASSSCAGLQGVYRGQGSGMVGAGNSPRAWNAGQRSTPNISEGGHQRRPCNR